MFFLLFCTSVSSFELVKTLMFYVGKRDFSGRIGIVEYLSNMFSKINFFIIIKNQITIDRPM